MEDSYRRVRAEMHFQRTTRADQDESRRAACRRTRRRRAVLARHRSPVTRGFGEESSDYFQQDNVCVRFMPEVCSLQQVAGRRE